MKIMSDIRNNAESSIDDYSNEEDLYDAYKSESMNNDQRTCHARQNRNRSS